MVELERHARGTVLPVRVHAGARQNALLGERRGMLRVAVTAAPEKGKANRAVIELLSDAFGLAKSNIELLTGETSRQKRFLFVGARPDSIRNAIATSLGESLTD